MKKIKELKPETKQQEQKKITHEDIWNRGTFAIPQGVLVDHRQEGNVIISAEEADKIIGGRILNREPENKYKRTFQYF